MTKYLEALLEGMMWSVATLSTELDRQLKQLADLSLPATPDEIEVVCGFRRVNSIIWNNSKEGNPVRLKYLLEEGRKALKSMGDRERAKHAEKRVHLALVPQRSKPAPVRHRSPKATNVGPTTQKGTNPPVPKNGGHGTSRDALRRRRSRQRQVANA